MEADRTGDRDEWAAAYGTAQGAGAVSYRAFGLRCGDEFGIFGALSGDDGASLVVLAIASGKQAAARADASLMGYTNIL